MLGAVWGQIPALAQPLIEAFVFDDKAPPGLAGIVHADGGCKKNKDLLGFPCEKGSTRVLTKSHT
jgi:hypothetical protein